MHFMIMYHKMWRKVSKDEIETPPLPRFSSSFSFFVPPRLKPLGCPRRLLLCRKGKKGLEGGKRKARPTKKNALLFVGGPERRRGAAGFRARRRGRRGQGLGRAGQLGEGEVGH